MFLVIVILRLWLTWIINVFVTDYLPVSSKLAGLVPVMAKELFPEVPVVLSGLQV